MPITDSGGGLLRNTLTKEVGSIGTSGAHIEEGIFEQYEPCQFTIAGLTLAFPVVSISEEGGNRIVSRVRPYRNGAKLDDTGSTEKRWRVSAIFNNSLLEKGIAAINQGLPLYPDVLNFLILNFDIHETADLVLPTIGKVRCRLEHYSRDEKYDERDQATLVFLFVEDNEDNVDFRSISAPSGAGNAERLAATTEFDAQSFGGWSDAMLELQLALLDLEEFANAPQEQALDVEAAALRVEGAARRAEQQFSQRGIEGRNLFLDPANSRGGRKITKARDLAGRERARARQGNNPKMIIVFRDDTSLFQVATVVKQDFVDLLSINSDLDPNYIPARTPVNVFATQELLNGSDAAKG